MDYFLRYSERSEYDSDGNKKEVYDYYLNGFKTKESIFCALVDGLLSFEAKGIAANCALPHKRIMHINVEIMYGGFFADIYEYDKKKFVDGSKRMHKIFNI